MSTMTSQTTGISIVYSTVFSAYSRPKKISELCVTGLCEGNSPVTGEFPAQRASIAENVSIWWRHHDVSTHSSHQIQHSYQLVIELYFVILPSAHEVLRCNKLYIMLDCQLGECMLLWWPSSKYGTLLVIIPPTKRSCCGAGGGGGGGGVYWFHSVRLSVRLSVRPSVCPSRIQCPRVLVRSILYLYILSSNIRRCVACKVSCKIWIFGIFFFFNLGSDVNH